jgi:hypothetical protein
MATNKAKRSIHLAQPQPQHVKTPLHPEPAARMPVKPHVYRAIAEMNGGFEQALQGLQELQKINFFPLVDLINMHKVLSQMRSRANRQLMAVLIERETSNAHHFQQLLIKPEKREPQAGNR